MVALNAANAKAVKAAADSDPFAPLPEGKYRVELVKVESKTSSTKKPMWVWDFKVTEPADYKGKNIRTWTVLQDNLLWRLAQVFKAFGVGSDTDTDDLVGKTIMIEVEQQMNEKEDSKSYGKMNHSVKDFLEQDVEPIIFKTADTKPAPATLAKDVKTTTKRQSVKASDIGTDDPPF